MCLPLGPGSLPSRIRREVAVRQPAEAEPPCPVRVSGTLTIGFGSERTCGGGPREAARACRAAVTSAIMTSQQLPDLAKSQLAIPRRKWLLWNDLDRHGNPMYGVLLTSEMTAAGAASRAVDRTPLDRTIMLSMRIRAGAIVALGVVAAVLTSEVATCIPAAMAAPSPSMVSCMDEHVPMDCMAEHGRMNEVSLCAASAPPMDCCTHVTPQITVSKIDLVKAQPRSVPSSFSTVPPADTATGFSCAFGAESPPTPAAAHHRPLYIAFSIFLV